MHRRRDVAERDGKCIERSCRVRNDFSCGRCELRLVHFSDVLLEFRCKVQLVTIHVIACEKENLMTDADPDVQYVRSEAGQAPCSWEKHDVLC